jgi:hypothetical protein
VTLPPDLDKALVAVYRAWDRLERDEFGSSVLDFDLAESGDAPLLASRHAVLDELARLMQVVGHSKSPADGLVVARLQASTTYLKALLTDQRIAFGDYIRNTMCITPVMFPEARIHQAAKIVQVQLKNIPFSRKGLDAFRSGFETRTGETLKRQFEFFREKWLTQLLGHIDAKLDPSSIAVEFAEEDAYWKNWISGNVAEGEPIKLRINVHGRHVWYQGAVEILVIHEYCGHAVQMALWHDAVRKKRIASFFGVLTVHFPDQYLLEGLAEGLAYILPKTDAQARRHQQLEPNSVLIRDLSRYNLLVLNNVHIIANDQGLDAARTYARQRLPFTSDETIERELRDRTTHPLFRAYQYVYAPAKEAFIDALAEPSPHRWPLMRELYRSPMMPAQVQALLDTI